MRQPAQEIDTRPFAGVLDYEVQIAHSNEHHTSVSRLFHGNYILLHAGSGDRVADVPVVDFSDFQPPLLNKPFHDRVRQSARKTDHASEVMLPHVDLLGIDTPESFNRVFGSLRQRVVHAPLFAPCADLARDRSAFTQLMFNL